MNKYYHFCGSDRRLGYGDGREIRIGETLTVNGAPVLCDHGLHASRRVIDALSLARGPILCRVSLGGTIIHGNDKSVATERTVIDIADCTIVLRDFARRCALDVVDLWDAPDIVIQYLRTGDESIRAAAWAAARVAARAAAWDAERAAAWDAAWAAARAAEWAAEWAAARVAERAAARAAEWDAARERQNRRLTSMLRYAPWEASR